MATNRPTTAPTQPTDSVARPVPPPVELSRCFICLDDDDDAPELANEWVFPSKCSLAAHQSCMLAWVRNRELENQPLNCPVCLEPISLVQQSDVLVSIADKFTGIISHVAPRALVTMILGGTITGMALYGAGAVWVFAGKDALAECIKTTGGGAVFLRWRRVMALPCVGPMLILGYTLPPVPVPLSVPLLAIYSSFLVGFDPGTFSWPPSAATAFVALPYFQTAYSSLYQALFQNYEDDLDRRLNGLPPALIDGPVNPAPVAAPAPAPAPAPAQNGDAQQDRQNGDDEIDEVGRLQGLLRDMRNALTFIQNVNVEAEIIEEPVFEEEEEPQVEVAAADRRTAQQDMDRRILAAMDWENANVLDIEDPWADGPVARPDSPYEGGRPAPVPVVEAPAPAPVAAAPAPVAPAQPARAPAAAPGRPNVQIELELNEPVEIPPAAPGQQARPGRQPLRTTVNQLCIHIAAALVLPGVSCVMGEVLKWLLPRKLSMMARIPSWSGQVRFEHTGLLQTKWGRSLVGGAIYLVFRDAVRLWIKGRRANITSGRQVRSVPRKKEK